MQRDVEAPPVGGERLEPARADLAGVADYGKAPAPAVPGPQRPGPYLDGVGPNGEAGRPGPLVRERRLVIGRALLPA